LNLDTIQAEMGNFYDLDFMENLWSTSVIDK
jgi:hypothetical protein